LRPTGTIPTRTAVRYLTVDGFVVLAIWSDFTGGGSGPGASSHSPDIVEFHGTVKRRGQSIEYEGTANATGDGRIRIDGTEYNLAQGCIFLLTRRDGAVRLKQLKRDRIKVGTFSFYIEEFARENEVGTFFETSPPESNAGNSR